MHIWRSAQLDMKFKRFICVSIKWERFVALSPQITVNLTIRSTVTFQTFATYVVPSQSLSASVKPAALQTAVPSVNRQRDQSREHG